MVFSLPRHTPTLQRGLCVAVFPKEKLDTPEEPSMGLIFGCERSSLLSKSNNPNNFDFTLNLTCLPCAGVLVIPWHPTSIHKNRHTENPHSNYSVYMLGEDMGKKSQ
jgi:hypothetical protein